MKINVKITILTIIAILICASESNAYWKYTTIPGIYGGKDSNGAIICLGTTEVCFTLWEDVPGPGTPADPVPPGYFTGVALYVPSEGWGLTGINGVNYVQVGNNIIYSPLTTPETAEVSNESQIIEWLNNKNNQQP